MNTTPLWRRYLRFWRADLDRDTDARLAVLALVVAVVGIYSTVS
jgi:hypothetical protein